MFTGDADMTFLEKLKDTLKIQGKLRYSHKVIFPWSKEKAMFIKSVQ